MFQAKLWLMSLVMKTPMPSVSHYYASKQHTAHQFGWRAGYQLAYIRSPGWKERQRKDNLQFPFWHNTPVDELLVALARVCKSCLIELSFVVD